MVSSGIEACGICKSGYALDATTGGCVAEKVPNCYTQNGSTCLICDDGFYQKDLTCAATDV